jgi:5,10-methylene-tetrahydrofolate dehydrogenase/methenyl tetrahydrofolate cyclohydrolase
MEKTDSINHNVAIVERARAFDKISILSKEIDVSPENQIHSTQGVEKATCFLNSQEFHSILVDFPLVEKICDHFQLSIV